MADEWLIVSRRRTARSPRVLVWWVRHMTWISDTTGAWPGFDTEEAAREAVGFYGLDIAPDWETHVIRASELERYKVEAAVMSE